MPDPGGFACLYPDLAALCFLLAEFGKLCLAWVIGGEGLMLLMEEGLIAIVVAGTPDLVVLGKTIYQTKTSGNR
jgi:hypothetical protein